MQFGVYSGSMGWCIPFASGRFTLIKENDLQVSYCDEIRPQARNEIIRCAACSGSVVDGPDSRIFV